MDDSGRRAGSKGGRAAGLGHRGGGSEPQRRLRLPRSASSSTEDIRSTWVRAIGNINSPTRRGSKAVGGDAARGRIDRRARREGGVQGRRLLRLDRHDARPAGAPRRDAADQSAAADRHQQRVDAGGVLLQLQGDAALAEQGLGLVVGMDCKRAGLRDMGFARRERICVAAARQSRVSRHSP